MIDAIHTTPGRESRFRIPMQIERRRIVTPYVFYSARACFRARTWFARAPGDAVVTPRGVDHAPCGGVDPWRPPDRKREALVSAVWNRTRKAFGRP